jgi:hypothetical protein
MIATMPANIAAAALATATRQIAGRPQTNCRRNVGI